MYRPIFERALIMAAVSSGGFAVLASNLRHHTLTIDELIRKLSPTPEAGDLRRTHPTDMLLLRQKTQLLYTLAILVITQAPEGAIKPWRRQEIEESVQQVRQEFYLALVETALHRVARSLKLLHARRLQNGYRNLTDSVYTLVEAYRPDKLPALQNRL